MVGSGRFMNPLNSGTGQGVFRDMPDLGKRRTLEINVAQLPDSVDVLPHALRRQMDAVSRRRWVM